MSKHRRTHRGLVYLPFRRFEDQIRKKAIISKEAPSPQPPVCAEDLSDEELFAVEMADVRPLPHAARSRLWGPRTTSRQTCPVPENIDVMDALSQLVAGDAPLDPTHSDEYISWCAPGTYHSSFRALKQGLFPVQAHLDLHGMTVGEAQPAVSAFLRAAAFRRLRCVLIVHGRGHNSKDNEPVLKKVLEKWLRGGGQGRMVKAYASALNYDGGLGAVYVLLRA